VSVNAKLIIFLMS